MGRMMPSTMSPEEELICKACLAKDEELIAAFHARRDERLRRYRAYTNDTFNPIYTKEVVASFYELEDYPTVSIYHPSHPLNYKPR